MELPKDELIGYLGEVIALEAYCYGAKELIDYLETTRIKPLDLPGGTLPDEPPRPSMPEIPKKPEKKEYTFTFADYFDDVKNTFSNWVGEDRLVYWMFGAALFALILVFTTNTGFKESLYGIVIFCVIIIAAVFAGLFVIVLIFEAVASSENKQRLTKQNEDEYETARLNYESQIKTLAEKYTHDCREVSEAYERLKQAHDGRRNERIAHNQKAWRVNGAIGRTQELLNKGRNNLIDNLKQLYALGYVYPKYRNLVAVSSFYEYLDSGRCDALEGADGAYNVYENELRLDRIIDKLDVIIKKLDQIIKTQYKLYTELVKVNENITELKTSIDEGIQSIKTQVENSSRRISELSYGLAEMNEEIDKGFVQMDEYLIKLDKASTRALDYLSSRK